MRWSKNNLLAFVLDMVLVALGWWLAFWLRFNLDTPDEFQLMMMDTLPWPLLGFGVSLLGWGVYRHIWRYTSVAELTRLIYGVVFAALLTAAAVLMLRVESFPRSVLLLHPMLVLLLLGAARTSARLLLASRVPAASAGKPLLLVGSVQDAAAALPALRGARLWSPVGIVSPVATERGRTLQGLSVLGGMTDLPRIAKHTNAAAAVVVSAVGSDARRQALMGASEAGLPLLTMPRPDDWLRGETGQPRQIELEDLLGRTPVLLDEKGLSDLITGQTVLVTGAGGSIGSELCRQIARFGVARLVCVDVSEFAIYQLEQELRAAHPQMQGLYYTANVREADRLLAIARLHPPTVVFHAAAYKHVPLMESLNEIEALRTNVLGTLHCARVAGAVGAARFVLISTDKAVNPTNVMGASKRLAERVMQAVAAEHAGTRYVAVRFGNVLGSSGSVVPLFTAQIARGGPLTVTHPDIVRYFMTIPEAAQLVLQAGLLGQSGQIFVLDMGEPVKIVELARILIRLSGKTEQEVPVVFTGLRPGEKLFEELLANGETTEPTPHPKLHVAKTNEAGGVDLGAVSQSMVDLGAEPSASSLRAWLHSQVPEYAPR
ncbi:FlaA1/EpsC-like NDP-sugar epimerase [Acidovorax sp. 69]|uniref:polysaccharide biosynthesis protein n=1 Tax=Acidovorax sp. 69 TaxID=2035202 RepID=UPI000CA71FC2|nr:nucleoside-diphosphate sugar epimerase/dehydratase [Acidovorax sp. 69]PJI96822.1 FlaA1/EpsC-like NDP-sugar epimerase [Acidovorax sp. 69]